MLNIDCQVFAALSILVRRWLCETRKKERGAKGRRSLLPFSVLPACYFLHAGPLGAKSRKPKPKVHPEGI